VRYRNLNNLKSTLKEDQKEPQQRSLNQRMMKYLKGGAQRKRGPSETYNLKILK